MFCKLWDIMKLEMRCSAGETRFTEYVQVTFQWDLVSLLAVSGNLPRWRLSWVGIKNVSTQREGKKIARLNPTDTPPPWLRWSALQVKAKLAGLSPRCLGDGHLLRRRWTSAGVGGGGGRAAVLAELLARGSAVSAARGRRGGCAVTAGAHLASHTGCVRLRKWGRILPTSGCWTRGQFYIRLEKHVKCLIFLVCVTAVQILVCIDPAFVPFTLVCSFKRVNLLILYPHRLLFQPVLLMRTLHVSWDCLSCWKLTSAVFLLAPCWIAVDLFSMHSEHTDVYCKACSGWFYSTSMSVYLVLAELCHLDHPLSRRFTLPVGEKAAQDIVFGPHSFFSAVTALLWTPQLQGILLIQGENSISFLYVSALMGLRSDLAFQSN